MDTHALPHTAPPPSPHVSGSSFWMRTKLSSAMMASVVVRGAPAPAPVPAPAPAPARRMGQLRDPFSPPPPPPSPLPPLPGYEVAEADPAPGPPESVAVRVPARLPYNASSSASRPASSWDRECSQRRTSGREDSA